MDPNKCINTFQFTLAPGGTVRDSVVKAAAQANTILTEGQIAIETDQVLAEQQIGGANASLAQRHAAARHLPVGYEVTVVLDAPSCAAEDIESVQTQIVPAQPTKGGDPLEGQPFSLWTQPHAAPTQTNTLARQLSAETHTANPDAIAPLFVVSSLVIFGVVRTVRNRLSKY